MARSPTKNKGKDKKKRKLEVIAMRERGLSWVKIAQDKNMHEATARSIYAKKVEIRSGR